jgi:tRNA 2-thiocytidine biosynthesis protein TtcA
MHLDMGYGCIHSGKMEKFFKENGYEYYIKKINILDTVNGDRSKIDCFWCSWNRRKHLFELAHKYKCSKLALGHHMDDVAHTLLLNLFFQADFSSMAPKQELFKGKIHIIRPLVYVGEKELTEFAKESEFPLACCRCPNAGKNNRTLMRDIIARVEKVCPSAKVNLFRSIYKDERFLKGYRNKAKRKKI